jgi:hypothetical protein
MISCSDFPEAHCCTSCHEDDEQFGYPLSELYECDMDESITLGKYIGSICCAVSVWLDKQDNKVELIRQAVVKNTP